MKIVVIEDESAIRKWIIGLLEKSGYEYFEADNGNDGLNIIQKHKPNLVILDLGLPTISGFEVSKEIRKDKNRYGEPMILMLTAYSDIDNKINGFESGADDYLAKPFNDIELIYRIKALLKRNSQIREDGLVYQGLSINGEANTLIENGKDIVLTKKEFQVLSYLIENKGNIVSKEKLYELFWDDIIKFEYKAIDNIIYRLRNKSEILKENIVTVKDFGVKIK